jgi:MFS family permease
MTKIATSYVTHNKMRTKNVTIAVTLMCILATLFYCYEYYLRVAPSVMKAELQQAFLLSETGFGYLAACYYYAYTPMQIPVGIMMDRFGPRRILTFACFLCAAGTYFFAATSHVFIAQIGRILLGFGSAFAYVGVLKISDLWLPKKYFALMVGVSTALGMVGAITGEMTMEYLVDAIGWQTTLNYAASTGIVLTLLLWVFLRDGENEEAPSVNKKPALNLSFFSGLRTITNSKAMWINGVVGCLTFLPITGFAEVWAPNYLMILGLEKKSAAIGSSLIFLGFAIGGPIWGMVSEYLKSRRLPLILGGFVAALFMSCVIWLPNNGVTYIYTLLFLSGFFASVQILIFAIANDLAGPKVSATAAAFTNMLVMIGGMVLPPLIGTLLDVAVIQNQDVSTSVQDYALALTAIPVALILASILSLFLQETHKFSLQGDNT